MNLLFIFTGGTIGATRSGKTISVDAKKPYLLLEKYAEAHPITFTYDTLEPFFELSENFSGEHISRLLTAVKEKIDRYDGIIVTHGTDTLPYSAAALGYALGNTCKPVCLVSANYPIEDGRSNGIDNLFAAVSLISCGTHRGVFVPYRNNPGEVVLVHRASRLCSSLTFSDDIFSVAEIPYGAVDKQGVLHPDPRFTESADALQAPSSLALTERAALLRVYPYPGMSYPAIPEDTRTILLETYHSGTVNAKSEDTRAFLAKAKDMGIPVFVTGATGEASYDSTSVYAEFGVTPLVRISPIAAYMKIWLYGKDANGTLLHTARGGDLF